MLRWVLLQMSQSDLLRKRVPRYSFVQTAARRFLPGEDLDAALEASGRADAAGAGTILTYLGEEVRDEREAAATTDAYITTLERVAELGLDGEVSVKLTQLGLPVSSTVCHDNLQTIVENAAQRGNFVWIDMEGSAYTDVTLEHFRRVRERFSNVGVCLQAYLYRTANDLNQLLPLEPAIRLVKGAYNEPRAIAFPRKPDVDDNFFRLGTQLLEQLTDSGRVRPAFATHDHRLIERLNQYAAELGCEPGSYEFQLLYGIDPQLEQDLLDDGRRLRILISYGAEWFPWYMRRLAERPANVLFVVRNLVTARGTRTQGKSDRDLKVTRA